MSEINLDLAHRRLVNRLRQQAKTEAATAAAGVAATATSDAQAGLDTHTDQRQFVHGVGPSYVAKTKNASQHPDWTEIENKPPLADGPFDPTTLEIDGEQITTGTVPLNRLPVAAPGTSDATQVLRSDDPRLSTPGILATATESILAGDWVVLRETTEGLTTSFTCTRAAAGVSAGAAVGFVLETYGTGEVATVWTAGRNPSCRITGVTTGDVGRMVYLAASPGGTVLLPPISTTNRIQPVGDLIGVNTGLGTATVLMRWSLLIKPGVLAEGEGTPGTLPSNAPGAAPSLTGSPGISPLFARGDHNHPFQSAEETGAEPALGNPPVDGYGLMSTADGVRSWAASSASGVTSVALTLPDVFTVTVSPVTTSGSLTATLTSQTAGTVLAAPAGSAGTPTFRALAATDIPALAYAATSHTHAGVYQPVGSYLTANQTITASGDATGSGTTTLALTLATVATPGTYRSVTVDAKGRVTAGTNPDTLAGYGIGDAAPLSHTTNTSNPHSVTAAQVGAPTTTGTGASGTWPISVTGNSATTSQTSWAALTTTSRLTATGSQATSIATATGSLGGVEIQGPGGNTAAFIAFHRPGIYATYFGLDTDNVWKVGGWSAGAVAYPILHSGNYGSYAPTLTGTGASGTWPISVTGRATYLNTTYVSDMNSIVPAGVYQAYSPANQPTSAHWHWLQMPYLENSEGWAAQIAVSFYADALWFRRQSGATWQPWREVLHSGNYGSYAPTLTGTGASGTWPISVTGRATYLNTTYVSDMNSIVPAGVYQAYSPANQPTSAHWHWLQMPYLENSEGWAAQIAVSFYADALWFRRQSGATWQPWREVLHSSNYSSYALPLSGGAISGAVSVTTNATGVSTGLTVVNGDLTAYRSGGTSGVIYLGTSGARFLYYDGSAYHMPNANLNIIGGSLFTSVYYGWKFYGYTATAAQYIYCDGYIDININGTYYKVLGRLA